MSNKDNHSFARIAAAHLAGWSVYPLSIAVGIGGGAAVDGLVMGRIPDTISLPRLPGPYFSNDAFVFAVNNITVSWKDAMFDVVNHGTKAIPPNSLEGGVFAFCVATGLVVCLGYCLYRDIPGKVRNALMPKKVTPIDYNFF